MNISDFERVHAQYRNMVTRIAYGVLRDQHLAEDVCQEVFITLLRAKSVEMTISKHTQNYLAVAAKCRAIDYYRKRQKLQDVVPLEDMINLTSKMTVEEQVISDNMLSLAIDDLMKNKPDLYEALLHITIYRQSAKEAAQELGVSETTVRTRNSRALKYIEKRYGSDLL